MDLNVSETVSPRFGVMPMSVIPGLDFVMRF